MISIIPHSLSILIFPCSHPADHLPTSRSRRGAPQTGSASVLGHTCGLTTTSDPSFQRGSGSRGSTGNSNNTTTWWWWWRKYFWRASPKPGRFSVEQREEGQSDYGINPRERRTNTQYIGEGGQQPLGGCASPRTKFPSSPSLCEW